MCMQKDSLVIVVANHAVGNCLERGAAVGHRATGAHEPDDFVVVHRIAERHHLVARDPMVRHDLLDARGLVHAALERIDPMRARGRE